MTITILPAQPRHLAGIASIYDRECLEGIATFMTRPRTMDEWRAWLVEHDSPRHFALVAAEGDNVLGFASIAPWSPRQAYARTVESSVYVAPHAQGRGAGTLLMQAALRQVRAAGACVVIARVVDQNRHSVTFHKRLGFETIGIQRRAGEKFGQLLDVRIMDKHLDLE